MKIYCLAGWFDFFLLSCHTYPCVLYGFWETAYKWLWPENKVYFDTSRLAEGGFGETAVIFHAEQAQAGLAIKIAVVSEQVFFRGTPDS